MADEAVVASPLMAQLWNGNWPDEAEAQELADELYYQRAIHTYFTMLPALNVIGLRDGSEREFGSGYNVLPIWKDRMDSRALVPTPNADVVYSMSYLDLKQTGPLVVAAPPHVIGMLMDFFQHTITDVGGVGPDRGRGGLYLMLPPGYRSNVPDGYFAFTSSTYNVMLFWRTIMTQGPDGPDPARAVATAEATRIYPLWEVERARKPMEFPNGSGKAIDMMYPTDSTFYDKLKDFVDYEPVEAITPELRGVLASIGIVKGQKFEPTDKQRALLGKAVVTAPKMIVAIRLRGRADERQLYYRDRRYNTAWAGATADWMQESYLDVDQRATYFQVAYSSAPAMVNEYIDGSSKYPFTFIDGDGDLLHGSNQYRLHLPPNPPATVLWAVTLYNVPDGTMVQTPQLLPSIDQLNKLTHNDDGSLDLYFGPTRSDSVPKSNWIQTVDGRDFICAIRIYGDKTGFYDQTWKPDDVVKVT